MTVELREAIFAKYLTLAGEQPIIAKRQHPFLLIKSLSLLLLATVSLVGLSSYFILHILGSWSVQIGAFLLIINLAAILSLKLIINWYYHFYIITNRKIREIFCLASNSTLSNDVFLDQVRTTEISTKFGGFLGELINMGEVRISFDRPSHEEEFILKNISDPYTTGMCLGDFLETVMCDSPVWFKRNEAIPNHLFSDDVVRPPQEAKYV